MFSFELSILSYAIHLRGMGSLLPERVILWGIRFEFAFRRYRRLFLLYFVSFEGLFLWFSNEFLYDEKRIVILDCVQVTIVLRVMDRLLSHKIHEKNPSHSFYMFVVLCLTPYSKVSFRPHFRRVCWMWFFLY